MGEPACKEGEEGAMISFSSSSEHCLQWELLVFNPKALHKFLWDVIARQPSSPFLH